MLYAMYIFMFDRHGESFGTFFAHCFFAKVVQSFYLSIVFTANHNHLVRIHISC